MCPIFSGFKLTFEQCREPPRKLANPPAVSFPFDSFFIVYTRGRLSLRTNLVSLDSQVKLLLALISTQLSKNSCHFTVYYTNMEVIAAVAAWGIQIVSRNLPTRTVPVDLDNLQGRLSSEAHVYLPASAEFDQATTRWSVLDSPTFSVVVKPSVHNDVVETVKFANEMNLSYLPFNRGHGAITTVGKEQNGIGIWMDGLRSVEIAQDGLTATIGGGALSKDVTDTLWAAEKQTGQFRCIHTVMAVVMAGRLTSRSNWDVRMH